jgi:hypothetical protein
VSLSEEPDSLSSEKAVGTAEDVWFEVAAEPNATELEDIFGTEPAVCDDINLVPVKSEMNMHLGNSASFRQLSRLAPDLKTHGDCPDEEDELATGLTTLRATEEQGGTAASDSWNSLEPAETQVYAETVYEETQVYAETVYESQDGTANEDMDMGYDLWATGVNRHRINEVCDSQAVTVYKSPSIGFLNLATDADNKDQTEISDKLLQVAAQKDWAVEAASVVLLGGMPRSTARVLTPLIVAHDKSAVFAPLEVTPSWSMRISFSLTPHSRPI